MSLGLFDLLAPLLQSIDRTLANAQIPALVRIVLYAMAAAAISMFVYRRYSDQVRLNALRNAISDSQRALTAHEGSYAELQMLIRRNLQVSLLQLGLTLRPALIASLPLLFVLPWLSNEFELIEPSNGATLMVCATPTLATTGLVWQPVNAALNSGPGCWQLRWGVAASAGDSQSTRVFEMPVDARSPGIGKFTWFNWLIGNPAGYLPTDASIDAVSFGFEPLAVLPWGPGWLRRWPFWFFAPLLLASLWFKWRWRLR